MSCRLTKHFPHGTYRCPKCRRVTLQIVSFQIGCGRWRHRCPGCFSAELTVDEVDDTLAAD
ncbi:MAG: hypothetical protein AB7R89_03485 [Dehalococcoidia bacterium]